VGEGYVVSAHYDSLIAKLIAHGPDRAGAIARMEATLAGLEIGGIGSNVALHRRLMRDEGFRRGGAGISYLETLLREGGKP
jgi:acetyl-CoA carboxylase biotin carboxylase subunit